MIDENNFKTLYEAKLCTSEDLLETICLYTEKYMKEILIHEVDLED